MEALIGFYLIFGVVVVASCIPMFWEDMGWYVEDDPIDNFLRVVMTFCFGLILVPLWPLVIVSCFLAYAGRRRD